MPKILEHAKNILEAEERRGTLFWILHKIMEVICFSANVRQCWPRSQASPLSGRCMPGYSALLFQDGGRQSLHQDKGNRAADRADQTSRRVDWGRGYVSATSPVVLCM